MGIDVGGTGVKGAIVDTSTGELVTERYKIPTPANNNADIILDVIKQLVKITGWKGKHIGCGFPAVIKKGVSCTAANIDKSFIDFKIEKYFNKNSRFKFHFINDADAAGLAEMTFGVGKGKKGTVVLLTLGTGIGSAVFRDGKLVPNTEFGHLRFKSGVAEKYTSNKIREMMSLSWEEWGLRLNEYLNHIEFILSPDLIILGGGVSKKFENYKSYLNLKHCDVIPAMLKNHAGTIGAALSCARKIN